MSLQTQPFNSGMGIVRFFARKREIIREDDPADRIYEVIKGYGLHL